MPEYTYHCNNCEIDFAIISSIKNYKDKETCNICKSLCSRSYRVDMPTISGSIKLAASEIKTLGHLAQRNTETMSQDQKDDLYRKHNSYKDNPPEKPLPAGMTRLKKQPKIQWTSEPAKKTRRSSK